jgi:hypothetical protein
MPKANKSTTVPQKYTHEEELEAAEVLRKAETKQREIERSRSYHSFTETKQRIGAHQSKWERSQRAELIRLLQSEQDKGRGEKPKKQAPAPAAKKAPSPPMKTPAPTTPAPIQTPKK